MANGRLLRERIFDELWIQPAAGDAGGALGAAYAVWHGALGGAREPDGAHDRMQGAYLGPEFSAAQIAAFLDARGYPYERVDDDEAWARCSPPCSRRRRSRASCTAAWSSARARSATAPSSATRARRRCSRS
ncbi:MAG: hypothetical protein M5U28_43005 [Sandaracinaceae bacterium]|nr:hypothetical protein [Sandaracinaceae bacterium]